MVMNNNIAYIKERGMVVGNLSEEFDNGAMLTMFIRSEQFELGFTKNAIYEFGSILVELANRDLKLDALLGRRWSLENALTENGLGFGNGMRFLYDRPIRIEKDFDELTCIKQLVIQFGEWLMANYDSDELSVFYKS